MLLVDANVLLYAANRSSPHHGASRGWLDSALGAREPVAFAWIVLLAFLRLSTRGDIFERPLSLHEAAALIESWLAAPAALILEPSARHLGLLSGLLDVSGTAGNLVNDAHLASLALEHAATVVSFDRDFARFAGLRVHTPSE